MDKDLLRRLDAIISSVIQGDYSQSVEMDRMQDSDAYTQEEVRLLKSLGYMSVKLEAREFVLEETIKGLQSRNAELLEEKKRNNLFSKIFVSLFLSVSLYIFLVILAAKLNYESKDSARIVEVIFLMVSVFIIRKSGFSFSFLGVTLKGAVESIRRMLPGTLAACGALILFKILIVMFWAEEVGDELFVMDNFDLTLLAYLPVAIIQEFISRGVIQTSIESVLDKPYNTIEAILTASALFGLVHIQLSVELAFASFVCSLYWGYLYIQKRCLVGVSISHFMIGGLAYVLGLWDYLYII